MAKTKFQFGDCVIGNKLAKDVYGVTKEGTMWVVVEPSAYKLEEEMEEGAEEKNENLIGVCRPRHFEVYLAKREGYSYEAKDPQHHPLREFRVMDKCFDFVKHIFVSPNKGKAGALEKYDD